MNFLSIVKYSLILTVVKTSVSTASTMYFGVENLAILSPSELFIYQYIPIILVSLLVLFFYSRIQSSRTLLHLLAVVSLSELFGFAVVSILMGEFYFSPTWFIDVLIAALIIVLSAIIGSKIRTLTELSDNKKRRK